jgi:hypothetical protein
MKRKTVLLVVVAVLLATQIACGVVITQQIEPSQEDIRSVLNGQQAIVFGDESFVSSATINLEQYGVNIQTALDLPSALKLAGGQFVEIHCDNDLIIQAKHAEEAINSLEMFMCDHGFMFLNARTMDEPDIIIGDNLDQNT